MKASYLALPIALACCGAGAGVQYLITAPSAKVAKEQATVTQAKLKETQEALRTLQARLDAAPEETHQAVEAEKTRLQAAFEQEKAQLQAQAATALQKEKDQSAAALKDSAAQLVKAGQSIEALHQTIEAQKDAIQKNNQYIATLGTKLRAAYATTPNPEGKASLDKLDADRAREAAALETATGGGKVPSR